MNTTSPQEDLFADFFQVGGYNNISADYEWSNKAGRSKGNRSPSSFYKKVHIRQVGSVLGISRDEYKRRSKLVSEWEDKGLNYSQIIDYANKFQLRGGNWGDLEGLSNYIKGQELIKNKKIEQEEKLIEKLEKEEEAKVINEMNLFPDEDTIQETGTQGNTLVQEEEKSNTMLYVYGGLGILALVGIAILIKRK